MSDLIQQIQNEREAVEAARRKLRSLAKDGKSGEKFTQAMDELSVHSGNLGKLNYKLALQQGQG